jgi:hypothetical protein
MPKMFYYEYIVTYEWLAWRIIVGSGSDETIIGSSPVVTTNKYNIVTDFHTTNQSTLIFPVYFH